MQNQKTPETTPEDAEIERLAEASGLTVEEVKFNLASGLLFYREQDYFGSEQPPGVWLDSKGTEYVVAGHGHWGRGATPELARAAFRRYGGVLRDGYLLLTFGPGSVFLGIGPMGWRYLGEPPAQTEVEPRSKR